MRRSIAGVALGAGLLSACGCATVNNFYNRLIGNDQPQQVTPDQFQRSSGAAVEARSSGESGNLGARNPPLAPLPASPAPIGPPGGLNPVVTSAVPSPAEQFTAAATQPSTAPAPEASLASGQYMSLGGVVAEVNGSPIFVNKVLQLVAPTLRNDARQMALEQFTAAARSQVLRAIQVLESNELAYAAAEHNLEDSDKKLVTDLTTAYRQQLITLAGGSVEVARRKAAANGDDFDELVHDKYRETMIRLYYQRKYFPLAEPSAQEMRQYYQQNQAKFIEPAQAVFDLIKIDPSQIQSDTTAQDRQMAFDRAKQAHDRAVAGENFATLFDQFNNDPALKDHTNDTGNMGTIDRGSFFTKEVEDAVWNLQPGQVTDVIEVDGILYIAKLESRKNGVTHPFEDQTLQKAIHDEISRNRLKELGDEEIARLREQAITTENDQAVDTTVDMAMQSYQVWSK
jgi:parvulin-like peptidyl-prolyl isomerase